MMASAIFNSPGVSTPIVGSSVQTICMLIPFSRSLFISTDSITSSGVSDKVRHCSSISDLNAIIPVCKYLLKSEPFQADGIGSLKNTLHENQC